MSKDEGVYKDALTLGNKLARAAWIVFAAFFFRPFAGRPFRYYRGFILRLWGAKLGKHCSVAANAKIWAPWSLVAGDYVCIAPRVDFYNVAPVIIGDYVTISQDSFICTASHDIGLKLKPLMFKSITINSYAWVCARAVVLPGVTLGDGSVVGCASVVSRDVAPWTVVVGNPAKVIKQRELRTCGQKD